MRGWRGKGKKGRKISHKYTDEDSSDAKVQILIAFLSWLRRASSFIAFYNQLPALLLFEKFYFSRDWFYFSSCWTENVFEFTRSLRRLQKSGFSQQPPPCFVRFHELLRVEGNSQKAPLICTADSLKVFARENSIFIFIPVNMLEWAKGSKLFSSKY